MGKAVVTDDVKYPCVMILEQAAVMADGEACDGTLAENAHQASQIWKIREGISEALPRCGACLRLAIKRAVYKYDVSLPTPLMHRLVEEVKAQLTQAMDKNTFCSTSYGPIVHGKAISGQAWAQA
eukprot:1155348-Pelagomonas_calceolata.AAC.1